MDLSQAKRILEGILFVSHSPVTIKRLREAIPGLEPEQIRAVLDELAAEYAQQARAFRIQEVAGGFQLVTDPELAPIVKRALELPPSDTLRKAALETLAIIAYKQPITKAEIEIIRGVDGGATLETLLERQLIKIAGRKDTPGRPLLYGTTPEFMRHFGLKELSELPPITDPSVMPQLPETRPIVPPDQLTTVVAGARPVELSTLSADAAEQPAESIASDQTPDSATETAEKVES